MGFNVLKRAQDHTKLKNGLNLFFKQKGIDLSEVERDPKYYEDLIMEYSRRCINTELFEESKEQMEDKFNRLCEFHRRHEEELVKRFFNITTEIISKQINKESEEKV